MFMYSDDELSDGASASLPENTVGNSDAKLVEIALSLNSMLTYSPGLLGSVGKGLSRVRGRVLALLASSDSRVGRVSLPLPSDLLGLTADCCELPWPPKLSLLAEEEEESVYANRLEPSDIRRGLWSCFLLSVFEGAGQREVSIHWPGRIFYRVEKAVWRRAGRWTTSRGHVYVVSTRWHFTFNALYGELRVDAISPHLAIVRCAIWRAAATWWHHHVTIGINMRVLPRVDNLLWCRHTFWTHGHVVTTFRRWGRRRTAWQHGHVAIILWSGLLWSLACEASVPSSRYECVGMKECLYVDDDDDAEWLRGCVGIITVYSSSEVADDCEGVFWWHGGWRRRTRRMRSLPETFLQLGLLQSWWCSPGLASRLAPGTRKGTRLGHADVVVYLFLSCRWRVAKWVWSHTTEGAPKVTGAGSVFIRGDESTVTWRSRYGGARAARAAWKEAVRCGSVAAGAAGRQAWRGWWLRGSIVRWAWGLICLWLSGGVKSGGSTPVSLRLRSGCARTAWTPIHRCRSGHVALPSLDALTLNEWLCLPGLTGEMAVTLSARERLPKPTWLGEDCCDDASWQALRWVFEQLEDDWLLLRGLNSVTHGFHGF